MRIYCQKHMSHQQYAEDLHSNLIRQLMRKSRRLSQQWLDAALILMRLNLEPARLILESLYPPISRASPGYKKLMNLRSGCERSNSLKKVTYGLGDRPCRSDTHFLVRLYLVSIIEHAKAWLAEDRKLLGDDSVALMQNIQTRAAQINPDSQQSNSTSGFTGSVCPFSPHSPCQSAIKL